MKLTASRRLYILGGVLFAALFLWARYRGRDGPLLFLAPLVIAGIAYLAAVRELFRTPKLARGAVFAGLVLSLLWRVPFFLIPAGPRDDLHRYVWDGRVQRLGYNPYTAIPADPGLSHLHTPETAAMNNPDVPSPYPAGAQLFFRVVTAIHESAFAFKAVLVGCDLAIILVLFDLLRGTGQPEHRVLAYAWHPLLATEVAGGGHIDILGVLLLVISAAALARRWRAMAAIAFGLAVAVKFLPIVLAPLYWRRVRVRHALLAAFVVGAMYIPFLEHGRIPTGSLGAFVQRFRFNDPVFAVLERIASPRIVAGLAVLAGCITAAWLRRKQQGWPWEAWPWPMAASLVCAPVSYPWYLLWMTPFLGSPSTLPLSVWSVSILLTYHVWFLERFGYPWQVPGWIVLLEYGSVVLAAVVAWFREARKGRQAGRFTQTQGS